MPTSRLEGNDLILAARYIVTEPCDVCGEDLDLHKWVDVAEDGMMVACDRYDPPTCSKCGELVTGGGAAQLCLGCFVAQ
jgi:rRNA maturation protein Nop10